MPRTASVPKFVGEGRIVFADREYPDPGPGQLLLAVEANAICGTDREQYYEGSECVPGHEAAGTVIGAGDGHDDPVGTRGAVFLMDYCGRAAAAGPGYTNQCLAKRNDMGFTADGGYGPVRARARDQLLRRSRRAGRRGGHAAARRDGHRRSRAGADHAHARGRREPLLRRRRPDRPGRAGHGQGAFGRRLPRLHLRRLALAAAVRRSRSAGSRSTPASARAGRARATSTPRSTRPARRPCARASSAAGQARRARLRRPRRGPEPHRLTGPDRHRAHGAGQRVLPLRGDGRTTSSCCSPTATTSARSSPTASRAARSARRSSCSWPARPARSCS